MNDQRKVLEYDGETFLLSSSDNCIINVSCGDKIIGFVGVPSKGMNEAPFALGYWSALRESWPYGTPDQLVSGEALPFTSGNVKDAVELVCRLYLEDFRKWENNKSFRFDDACGALQEFYGNLKSVV